MCKLSVVLRTLDDGTQANDVRNVDVIGTREPTADPFAPGPCGPPAGGGESAFGADGGAAT